MREERNDIARNHRRLSRLAFALRWSVAVACTTGACGQPLSEKECTALLERYVDRLLDSDRAGLSSTERIRIQLETRRKAAKDPAFQRCRQRVSRRQFNCAMRAPNVDRMEQCLL